MGVADSTGALHALADKVAEWHTHQYRPLKCPMQRMHGYDPDLNTQAAMEMHHKVRFARES